VVERGLDLCCLGATIAVLAVRLRAGAFRAEVGAFVVLLVVATVAVVVAGYFGARWRGVMDASSLMRAAGRLVDGVKAGARELWQAPWRGLAAAWWSAVAWLAGAGATALVLSGFPSVSLDAGTASAFWVAVQVSTAAVPTPGGFGAYEAAGAATLVRDGASPEVAAVAATWAHLATFGFNLVVALVALVSGSDAADADRGSPSAA
jgi:uncharacterized membrane protein YbhN (UPF0104 family)